MNSVPSISVALCTYNGERFLQEQLISIANQTLLPREIVISDDGSNDGTLQVIESFVANLKSTRSLIAIKVFTHDSKLGISKNFEFASSICSSELIAFCDQDDVWPKDKLEKIQAEFILNPQLLMVFSDAHLVNESGTKTGVNLYETVGFTRRLQKRVNRGEIFHLLIKRNVVTGATMVVRKTLLRDAFPIPEGWLHDEWCAMFLALSYPKRVLSLQAKYLNYRQHGQNEVGAAPLDAKRVFSKLFSVRTERNAALLHRADSLSSFVNQNKELTSPAVSEAVSKKLEHEKTRSQLPNKRIKRVYPICKQFLAGGYTNYGNGIKDVLRDLLQPG